MNQNEPVYTKESAKHLDSTDCEKPDRDCEKVFKQKSLEKKHILKNVIFYTLQKKSRNNTYRNKGRADICYTANNEVLS